LIFMRIFPTPLGLKPAYLDLMWKHKTEEATDH